MTAQEFLKISAKLVADMKIWVAEAAKDSALSPADLAVLNAAATIVERITLKEVDNKADTAN